MTTERAALWAALQERGVTSPDDFQERCGVALGTLTAGEALDCLWREDYVARYGIALAKLRERLERGLIYLRKRYSLAAEVRWYRLATRSTLLIGRLSRASADAGNAFTESELGRWYAALEWPEPSEAALREDWDTSVPHPARAA